jgi:predicted  nucleic acid-binding Zn-ribbon protein
MLTAEKIADILEQPAAYSHTDLTEALLLVAAARNMLQVRIDKMKTESANRRGELWHLKDERNRLTGRIELLEDRLVQAGVMISDLENDNHRLRKEARSQARSLCPKCGEPA